MYDIVIVGGGPAGLTAAIKAGTEGLSTLVIEKDRLGGRPVQSPLIENVPGWPEGIDGPELFGRMVEQATKFGAEFATGQGVIGLAPMLDGIGVTTQYTTPPRMYENYTGRSVILAMGEVTPRLEALRCFEGQGVDYACDAVGITKHDGQDVVLVGGGNSCAQLALAIAETPAAKSVTIISRSLMTDTTSLYLRSRLAKSRVKVVIGEVEKAYGVGGKPDGDIVALKVVRGPKFAKTVKADQVYVFVTGVPPTGWFSGAKTEQGYIKTGLDVSWNEFREPLPLETSIPGVFAAGDVRAGATGGITVAFGEGTQAFQYIKREYLPALDREEVTA